MVKARTVATDMKFKLFGTEIYISFLFAATVAFMLATDRTGLVIPTLFAVFVHEAGHLFAMWTCDCAPRRIRLVPASVQIVRSFAPKPVAEFAIILCGPAANIAVFAALYVNYLNSKSDTCLIFALINLIIFAFNMLPVKGLDGGTVLYMLLAKNIGAQRASGVLRIITATLGTLILCVGIYLAIGGKMNLSVFIVALYLFVVSIMKM